MNASNMKHHKMKHSLLLLFVSLLTVSCAHPDQLDQQIIGTWAMDKVYEYDIEVTEKHNPKKDRWIEFKTGGSFVSDGEPFGRNTGKWTADNQQAVLFLDSEVEDDDSEWKVTFTADLMLWTGIGHPRKEQTKLVHRRK
jgi:hypothetical protein